MTEPWYKVVETLVGQLARPFAIIVTSYSAAHATIIIATKVENGNDGAIFAGAYFLGVGTLYIGKAFEAISRTRARRDVDVAHGRGTREETEV